MSADICHFVLGDGEGKILTVEDESKRSSVTRLDNLLDFGQLFKAYGNN